MLIPIGFFGAGAAAGAYELISSTVLGSSAASVSFNVTGLSATYKHFQVRLVGRSTDAINTRNLWVRLNSDSGANYARHNIYGNGTSVLSTSTTAAAQIDVRGALTGSTAVSGAFGTSVVDLLDVGGTKNKTIRIFSGEAGVGNTLTLTSGLWLNTGAITGINFLPASGNFEIGSRFSLYGIKG